MSQRISVTVAILPVSSASVKNMTHENEDEVHLRLWIVNDLFRLGELSEIWED
jgi:abortive infection bacteriophage resistance protein